MKYDLEKKDGGIYVVTADIDYKEWQEYLDSAYEKNKGKFNVPGFRKGHAPRNVIESQYGEGVFVNDALDAFYYKVYTEVLREHEEVKPIEAPKLDIKKMDKTGMTIELSIPCLPDFELAPYKGLTFTKQKVEVTDAQIQEEIDKALLRSSRLVETNKPVKVDDYVNLDFDGYIDGKQFDGGKAENYQLKVGSHTFIDTFEDQLIGLNIGDKKDVMVTFPADYHEKSLAGKPATFKVEIKNIRERVMPEFNEEFVSNSTEFETVDAYKQSIKERLTKEAENRAEIELDNDILDKIIDDTNFVAPDSMVEDEYNRQYNGMLAQMQYQGIKFEDYAKYIGKTEEEFKHEIKLAASRNVKARVVLEKLLRDEKIDITEEEIDKKMEEIAKGAGKPYEEFKKQVNNDLVNRVANELLMSKLIDFLHKNNTIK